MTVFTQALTYSGPQTYRDSILASAPSFWWRADATTGAKDEITTTLASSTTALTGVVGLLTGDANGAESFDGTTSNAQWASATNLDLADNFSIEVWFKATAASGYLLDKLSGVSGYTLRWAAGSVFLDVGTGSLASGGGSLLTTNTVYHIVATKNAGSIFVYINGSNATTLTGSSRTGANNAAALNIGRAVAGGNFFPGVIDEVALYKRALSAGEVARHYQKGLGQTVGVTSLSVAKSAAKILTYASTIAPTKVASVAKPFSRTSTAAPSLVASRAYAAALVATVSSAASVVRRAVKVIVQTSITTPSSGSGVRKSMTSSSTGAVSRTLSVGKKATASASSALALAKRLVTTISFSATGTPSRTVRMGKTVSVSSIAAPSVTKRLFQTVTASASSTLAFTKRVVTTISRSATGTPSKTVRTGKTISASSIVTPNVTKRLFQTLIRTVTSSPTVQALLQVVTHTTNLSLTANVTNAASMTRLTALRFTQSITANVIGLPSLVKRVATALSRSATATPTVTRRTNKGISASTLPTSVTLSRQANIGITRSATAGASFVRLVAKPVSRTVTGAPSISRTQAIMRTLIALVSGTPSTQASVTKSLVTAASAIPVIGRGVAIALTVWEAMASDLATHTDRGPLTTVTPVHRIRGAIRGGVTRGGLGGSRVRRKS